MLSKREMAVAMISNGISVYSLLREQGRLPEDTTMYGFVMKIVPEDALPEVTAALIDEVFEYVSASHGS